MMKFVLPQSIYNLDTPVITANGNKNVHSSTQDKAKLRILSRIQKQTIFHLSTTVFANMTSCDYLLSNVRFPSFFTPKAKK